MKRDFISVDAPRAFLSQWEPWLQGGVAASRLALAAKWRDAFLRAPLWRFWLGPLICGFPVMGSFMSSVDGVGRFFPLTAIGYGDASDAFPPPVEDAQTAWFADVESLLLSTLEEGTTYDSVIETLGALPVPTRIPSPMRDATIRDQFKASSIAVEDIDALPGGFKALLGERDRRLYAGGSFWWTIGGDGFAPTILMSEGLPDPNIVTSMMIGQFAEASG